MKVASVRFATTSLILSHPLYCNFGIGVLIRED
jgi:hypothetical protein